MTPGVATRGVRARRRRPRRAAIAAIVEYDGSDYAGWQSQAHAASIQDAVQEAVAFVAGHPVVAICAGRTDAGVHATGQVIHFDTAAVRTPRAWVLGANTKLPPAIALQWAGRGAPRISCAAHGAAPHLSLLHFESQRALGAAADAHGVDSPGARRRGHASRRAGAARRA